MELMVEQVKLQRQPLVKTETKIRSLMSSKKYAAKTKLLSSVPGVGPTMASLFLLEVGEIKRFKGFDRLNNMVGFYPGSNSSADKDKDTGISKRKHKQLRTMLVEAVWQAVR